REVVVRGGRRARRAGDQERERGEQDRCGSKRVANRCGRQVHGATSQWVSPDPGGGASDPARPEIIRRSGPGADARRGTSGGHALERQAPGRRESAAGLREGCSVTAAVAASGALARGWANPVRPGSPDGSTRPGRVNDILAAATTRGRAMA